MINSNSKPPSIPLVPCNVYPTKDTLQEVVKLGESQLPITDKNVLFSLLMTYHNSLFKQLKVNNVPPKHR